MKIILDANTPAPLAGYFRGHTVSRAGELNWQNLTNGELLDAAEAAGFDVLITCDQNVRYQQNFTDRRVSVVILSTNHWPTLKPKAAQICTAVEFVQRGHVITIDVAAL